MAEGSIKSGIQLESYKVNKISFASIEDLGVLSANQLPECDVKWQFSFRNAKKITDNEKIFYVTGLKVNILITDNNRKKDIANGEFIITGLFSANGSFDKKTEELLIKNQGPALLFPYIRSSITMTLNSSGFPNIILPIINVNALAKGVDIKIEE